MICGQLDGLGDTGNCASHTYSSNHKALVQCHWSGGGIMVDKYVNEEEE
jgi:hypothetical protein